MTREEAIRKLQKQKAAFLEEWVDYSGVAEAYDMAIEALQREEAEAKGWCHRIKPKEYLPSERTGEWIKYDSDCYTAICSECDKVTMFERWGDKVRPYNYCPNCGAKMKGGAE